MRLRPEQLEGHLKKGLAPVYLVSGDEPLLVAEACDAVRAAARAAGYDEREVFHAETGFDWNRLRESANSLSLFASRRLIEVRLEGAKPKPPGPDALKEYAARPAADTILLVVTGKLDGTTQKSAWVTALEQAGAWVAIWPVEPAALPQWVAGRMRAAGLQPDAEAARLVAERVEGNLLAAVQEVEKLRLLHGAGPVDGPTVAAAVADSARFDVFTLADAALGGDPVRTARVAAGLRAEGVDPVLVLWALARETRTLAAVAGAREAGTAADQAFRAQRVWDRRKPLYQRALRRGPARHWQALLQECQRLDRVVKGQAAGNPWDELLQFALTLAGTPLLESARRHVRPYL